MTRLFTRRAFIFLAVALTLLGTERSPLAQAAVDVAKHGKRITLGEKGSAITVLYLKGTPYEMGYAQGKLCTTEVRYFASQVAPLMLQGLSYTPKKTDEVWKLYTKHLRPEYLEELKGLADGSGVSLSEIQRFHAIPDISEWHCSFFAAGGKATAGGSLVQIRALDYETKAGIQKYPALIVSQPTTGVPFVNVGWLGHCGVVSGMNAEGIAMSEIGDDWDKATDSFDGRPLNYVMRDTLQFSKTLQEAVDLVQKGARTTSLLYCISSAKEGKVRALKTSHTQCVVYTPKTLPFPTQKGMVYVSMGMDSAWNGKVGNYLKEAYGKIDVDRAKHLMKTLKTGRLHAVVFQPESGDVWVANATNTVMGYDRPYNHLNLKQALTDPFFQN
ncbi:MAG: C45 family autoproteolytic acyltransferase/hydrolase [Armatimonadetes bacterium]|nr:C45 family autoproteolytic acyltransferase/hydrolase [Armatimonadota bacterium]